MSRRVSHSVYSSDIPMKQAACWLSVLLGLLVSSPGVARAGTIAAGAEHTVVVTPDGHVWTWGHVVGPGNAEWEDLKADLKGIRCGEKFKKQRRGSCEQCCQQF